MPITGTEQILATMMYTMVKAEMGALPNPQADSQLRKLCAGLAKAIVPHITANAQVTPGSIQTAGSPTSQVSVSAGTIM